MREGAPVSDDFVEQIQHHVEAGDLEVLAARLGGETAGVLVLAFRPNVSLGGRFASIEDLYVRPEARRRGVGTALLKAADERCRRRGAHYLEAQIQESEASAFYAAFGYEPEPDLQVFSRSLVIRDRSNENPET
ncbi:GNAT family N-acetyltransferase [Rubrobacter tropicus]|uniref:GNAT family N-acetyltransferase n=1 Tax=Rubrobacter tropicus TaxID=2653851 RepID=UPI00140B3BC1|nr:GNAT family N-acetyltransferase [Rubrobacter tropicus]